MICFTRLFWIKEKRMHLQQLHIEKYHRVVKKQKIYNFWSQY